ncbi:MAG: hypothetical protein KZQ93_05060 [Candidatus Thiodiazotropha sp. (ex Monitilora ramsayi)]|nr:hypothetical protein [Candidatus Thiodiazotropha sp. (ex Monitilora ramsayi)]
MSFIDVRVALAINCHHIEITTLKVCFTVTAEMGVDMGQITTVADPEYGLAGVVRQ